MTRRPRWLPDEKLQAIAAENNLVETAFVMPGQDSFDLRWFSPTLEVDLCGHATLAAGFTLLANGYAPGPKVTFHTANVLSRPGVAGQDRRSRGAISQRSHQRVSHINVW